MTESALGALAPRAEVGIKHAECPRGVGSGGGAARGGQDYGKRALSVLKLRSMSVSDHDSVR